MTILENHSLKQLNSFGVEASAAYFIAVKSIEDLIRAVQLPIEPKLILGGGSNILFAHHFDGLIIHNEIVGISTIHKSSDRATVRVGGGVIWHDLVEWSLAHDLGGLENLSLIPGTAGAAPVQNIGAYGVEFEEVFKCLQAVELGTGVQRVFHKEDCDFGYRNSIFKGTLKGQFAIAEIDIELTHRDHTLNTAYGSIREELASINGDPTIQDVSNAVISIRRSKLPDPSIIGNAGSFFKNPVISEARFNQLIQDYPDMPSYLVDENQVKIPAAWLIEKCGWKGYRKGDAGIYDKHALVLVNHGAAGGDDLHELALAVQASVAKIFSIELIPEVRIL